MRRVFSTANKRKEIETSVCIVGSGPVGMTMSSLLNHFKVPNVILEKHPSLHGKIFL